LSQKLNGPEIERRWSKRTVDGLRIERPGSAFLPFFWREADTQQLTPDFVPSRNGTQRLRAAHQGVINSKYCVTFRTIKLTRESFDWPAGTTTKAGTSEQRRSNLSHLQFQPLCKLIALT